MAPRMPQDPHASHEQTGPSEFSWGSGLVPPGKEHAPPSEGGKYRGTTPRRNRPRPRDTDAPGSPGHRVR
jgi:hypothetical protein